MGETSTDTPLMAARKMLDIFASVGAERFHVTWTNSAGRPRNPRLLRKASTRSAARYREPPMPIISTLRYSRTAAACAFPARRPCRRQARRPRPAMFFIIETSPGNHQDWLEMPGAYDREFARRVRRRRRSHGERRDQDRGSLNLKDRYARDFPRVAIREAQPGRKTSPAELERLGLLAPLPAARPFPRGTDKWPLCPVCLDKAPRNRAGFSALHE
jgi:hypothetical protein